MAPNSLIPKLLALGSALSTAAHGVVTVNDSSFNGVTDGTIITAGTSDWGYISNDGGFFNTSYNNVDYGSLTDGGVTNISTDSGSAIAVSLTEGTSGTDTVGAQTNDSNFFFDGTRAYGSYGGYAPGEQDVWTLSLTNMAAGQYVLTLYMGHSSTNRSFDMDVSGTGLAGFTTTTGGTIAGLGSTLAAYGSSGAAFTYDIDFSTTGTSDVLTLVHGDTGGGSFGGAIFAGYTLTQIPEPSAFALCGLGAFGLLLRRRRG